MLMLTGNQMAIMKFIMKIVTGFRILKIDYTWEILMDVIGLLKKQRNIIQTLMVAITAVMNVIPADVI